MFSVKSYPRAGNFYRVCVSFSLVLMSLSALPVRAEKPLEVKPVVVSATRSEQSLVTVPASITVISREEIEASGASHVVEVLRGRGGVQVNDTFGDGSRASIGIRGFNESANANVLVLVDGRRLNNTDIAGPDLNSISLKDVERVEIIQGSAGTLYGDQAVGGVINIITRKNRKFFAEGEAGIGSYGRKTVRLRTGNRFANGLGYQLSGERLRSNNYRDNNRQDYWNYFGKLDWEHERGRVFLELQDVKENLRLAGRLTLADLTANRDRRQSVRPIDFAASDTEVARVGAELLLSDNWSLEGDWNYRKVTGFSRLVFFGANSDTPQERIQRGFTPRLVGSYGLAAGELVITIGTDIDRADYDTTNTFFGFTTTTGNRQEMHGIYAQALIPLIPGWTATIGGRQARVTNQLRHSTAFPAGVSLKDEQFVSEFGLSYRPRQEWRFFARRDGNFRFAKVDEQTFTSPGVVGLQTQTGTSWEGGAEWQRNGDFLKLVLYRLDLENEIGFDPTVADPFGGFTGANVNFSSTVHDGLILEGGYGLGPKWFVAGSYSYTDAYFDAGTFSGKQISGVSRHLLRATASYRIRSSLRAFLELQLNGDQFLSGDNANAKARQSGFGVLNLHVSYEYRGLSVSARVNNLLDRKYNEVENAFGALFPAPERNFMLTTRYRFD